MSACLAGVLTREPQDGGGLHRHQATIHQAAVDVDTVGASVLQLDELEPPPA